MWYSTAKPLRAKFVCSTATLDADPAARAEYDELRRLFGGLNAAQQTVAPEGLLAEVLSKVPGPAHAASIGCANFLRGGVYLFQIRCGGGKKDRPIRAARTQRSFQGEHNMRKADMSEQTNKTKFWIGGAIVVVALVVASRYFDIPSSHDMSGTIVPAQRSVAVQPGAGDVTGTGSDSSQTGLQSAQIGATSDAAIDAARSDAAKSDAARLDAARNDASRSDAARLDSAKSDAAKADAARLDAAKADAMKSDAAKFDAAKSDAMKADAAKFDAAKSDAMKVGCRQVRRGQKGCHAVRRSKG